MGGWAFADLGAGGFVPWVRGFVSGLDGNRSGG